MVWGPAGFPSAVRAWLAGHDHDLQHLRTATGVDVLVSGNGATARPRERFEKTVNGVFESGVYKLAVDLSGLDYISSAGAGVFIGAIGTAQENDGNIILMRPSANVKEVFDLLGLSQIFTFKESRDEAVKALK